MPRPKGSNVESDGKIIIRILSHAKPHWPWLIGFLLATTLVAALDSYFVFLAKQIVDEGILAASKTALSRLAITYGLVILAHFAGVFGHHFMASVLGHRVQYSLRQKMFSHLQELSFSYFDQTPAGWTMARFTSDLAGIAGLMSRGLLDVTWAMLRITTAICFMLIINWRLALIVFGVIPLLMFAATRFRGRIAAAYRQVRQVNARITAAYNETIAGVHVVKALCREEGNLREFGNLSIDMCRTSLSAAWVSALFLPTVQLISAVVLSLIIWRGGSLAQLGGVTIGGIQAFLIYAISMLQPAQRLAYVYAELQSAIASAERVFSLIDTEPDVTDRPGAIDPGALQGDIEFDHVSFWYEPERPVLVDFTLKVKQGERIALVGPTGGGKSTIVNLLCRFYEPREGAIRIGGQDYTELSLQALQSRIGVVLQMPHLFSGTIRENIRYGRLDATDAEIEAAARLVGAHDFIATLENGYAGEVGESGNLLSVGQKQLISLARVILARPEIFVMDEATSSVDTLTETLIQRGMERLMQGRTSFVIAHRLSTIKQADRILVIEDGRIAEMGNHTELLRAKGHYYRLYTEQFRDQLGQEPVLFEKAANGLWRWSH